MTENTPSDALVEAMALWERADRAGEDAYVEAVQIGGASADDAHKCGAIAAAAVIADALAERDAEIARLRERVERMGRDKETLLTFARAIQTWRSDADSYDEECDHPQRDYCEDVELMEKAAGYALRRIAERAALGSAKV